MRREDVYKKEQTWVIIRTTTVDDAHLVRIVVRCNAYASQTLAHTERWNGSQWVRIDHLPHALLPERTQAVSYTQPREAVIDGLREGVVAMHTRALHFFAAAESAGRRSPPTERGEPSLELVECEECDARPWVTLAKDSDCPCCGGPCLASQSLDNEAVAALWEANGGA